MNQSATVAPASAPDMRIWVNEQSRDVAPESTLASLLSELGLAARKGIAAAHNGIVVPRNNWPTHRLTAGDRVLVIQATQGG